MCKMSNIPPPEKIEKPVNPENKSSPTIIGTKYFAFIGTGINIIANSAIGNIKAKATNKP